MAIRDNLSRIKPGQLYNDAFWVGVERCPQVAPGAVFYQVVLIHHLTPEENGGNHNAYVDIIDESGALLEPMALGVRIGWTWKSRDIFGEPAPPVKPDKRGEPAGNVPIYAGMDASVWITTDPADNPPLANASNSERVIGLRLSGYPPLDGERNNRPGHNSYYIVFRRVVATAPPVMPDPPVVVTPPANGDVLAQLADLRVDFAQLAARVQILEDKGGAKG